MYVPAYFKVTDRAWALELVGRHPFGLLITGDAECPRVSHIPIVAQEREDGIWLIGHVARANAHAQSIREEAAATIVVSGPHAYVSAAWYEQPYATVPTWNYTAAHFCGRLSEFDAWRAVALLSAMMESGKPDAWNPQRLEPEYRGAQLRGIVAFELQAREIYAKAKLSQNRTDADRERVIRKLAASANQVDRECAQAMLAQLEVEQR